MADCWFIAEPSDLSTYERRYKARSMLRDLSPCFKFCFGNLPRDQHGMNNGSIVLLDICCSFPTPLEEDWRWEYGPTTFSCFSQRFSNYISDSKHATPMDCSDNTFLAFVVTAIHEIAHGCWSLRQQLENTCFEELSFDPEVKEAELGWAVERAIFGGDVGFDLTETGEVFELGGEFVPQVVGLDVLREILLVNSWTET
ncbi:hypothetical protein BDV96DRAFT_650048 [Lophiotrema nucula]|uniref:Uncharacterized protein n=1 Tax=Lophiotrema nucula TaxID=690887 RepID=A0A6A5YWM3_9PLEO|nr:hypothetical protein BDV96DRAFT_650048 [Lophiotrema nucula]